MSVTGDAQSAPLRVGYPVADTMGGITAAYAISAALFRRERSGEGEFIDVSMLESTLVAMGWVVSNWLIAGVRPQPLGNENMTASPSGTFRTGEGLLNIAANQQQQFETLCKLIGRPELAVDPRFAGREDRKRHRTELNKEIEQALAARSAAEWSALMNDERRSGRRGARRAGGAGASAGRRAPAAAHLQRRAECRSNDVSVVRSGFRLASGDPGPASPPPALGADTEQPAGRAWLFRK